MADCFRDDCSIRVYRSVSYTRMQKSGQTIAGLAGEVPLALYLDGRTSILVIDTFNIKYKVEIFNRYQC